MDTTNVLLMTLPGLKPEVSLGVTKSETLPLGTATIPGVPG